MNGRISIPSTWFAKLMDKAFAGTLELKVKYPQATRAARGNSKALITHVNDRPGHDRRYAIDAAKAMRELGYKPLESFESGIRKTVGWYLAENGWRQRFLKGVK